ncbi:MAG: glycerate kinase [Herbiconiux sp.]|nr:glycerate kinase [Herbiconiux sp.]TAJ50359.1 MAG: glycerate kinase [Herbiconiux sp.]
MLRVVIAPDSFKGTADAGSVARSLAEGWRAERPQDDVTCLPMADGGEGTLDAFEEAWPGSIRMPVTVTGPDDHVFEASWLLLPGPETDADADAATGGTAVVELASTSGITLLHPLRPLEAHSLGFGQAVRAALAHGVDRLLLAIGGSASTDGGAGVLTALGARFLDAEGRTVPFGNIGLGDIERVEFDALVELPPGGAVVMSDVVNPLLGRHGAVTVYGPQKGLGEGLQRDAERRLARFAQLVEDDRGTDPAAPGAGAAGGVGFGLLSWGAELVPGSAAVAGALGLADVVSGADLVITGEGRYDHQSESGKTASHVRDAAAAAGARTALVAGAIEAEPRAFDEWLALTDVDVAGSREAAAADPHRWLAEAARRLAAARP